jgi:hypothetical protein
MRTIELSFIGLTGSALLIAACSASGDGGGEITGGNGGTGTGGIVAVGGSSASAGTGGGKGGTGGAVIGQGGAISIGGAPMGGMAGLPICDSLSIVPMPLVPTVAIVVDNSSSMYEPREELFDRLYDSLMNPTTGAIKPLESKVRFGFASFRSPDETRVPETDQSCAQITNVPYSLDNFAAIDTTYKAVGVDGRRPDGCGTTPDMPNCGETDWETPTGHALGRIAADLAAYTPETPGGKYILFVTDGTPNTCMVPNPNCGQDLSLKAIQDAYAAGIGTFVVGIGSITRDNPGCTTSSMRCGEDHLQDVANAGSGQPVEPPPMGYWYEQCATQQSGTNPGTPMATYAAVGGGGTAEYFTATTAEELRTALTGLLTNVVSCSVEMNAVVTGNPALGMVTVGGNAVSYDDPNGWVLDMTTRYTVTLQGAACETFKGGAALDIQFPCDPVTMEPIAEPR